MFDDLMKKLEDIERQSNANALLDSQIALLDLQKEIILQWNELSTDEGAMIFNKIAKITKSLAKKDKYAN